MVKLEKVHSDSVSSSRLDHGGEQWMKPGLTKCKSVFTSIHRNKAAHVKEIRKVSIVSQFERKSKKTSPPECLI